LTKSTSMIAPLAVIAASLTLAGPALAQSQAQPQRSGEQLGLRYLSWAGKPAETVNDGLRRAHAAGAPSTPTAAQGRPSPVQTASLNVAPAAAASAIPRPNRYGSVSNRGLTPASAWISPRQPATQAELQATPAPQAYAPSQAPQPLAMTEPRPAAPAVAEAPQYDPSRAVRRQDPYYGAPPEVQAAMQPGVQALPVPLPPPPQVPVAAETTAGAPPPASADPMAPRRDALIFRMGSAASPPAASAPAAEAPRQLAQAAPLRPDAPARQGARYYSVHREAGHQPDPMTLPESVFIGGSADLAEPPPAPVVQRTVNGRAQAVVPNQDPALP
jgi:hypothetical protein